ncbi:MAG: DegT/DnrJ/EryC1/StrS family aminotransferase [Eubacteriales bacterium]|nr:DegT/DnrJ/EryC1/StrS family aminotransferase [Eubacteriales bacterium]
MSINVTRSSMPDYSEFCNEIKDLWDSHWLTNAGEKHKAFEAALKEYFDCPELVLYSNGHSALEGAIAAMKFPAGSEVITSPFTFASTTHAIVRNGLVPVFCDIKPDDFTIDPAGIESLITKKTVAILPIHVYGNVCDVDAIGRIAAQHKLKVIYDAAHAFGVKYRGQSVANFGDASMFSFHATKVFNTIEGGAVCFRDHSLLPIMNELKNFGIHGSESVTHIGGNAKMNEFQAAMGLCNLRHIRDEIARRKTAWAQYGKLLSGIKGITLPTIAEGVEHNYSYYPVVFDGYKKDRNDICAMLAENGIYARKYFYPLTSDFECYKGRPFAGGDRTPVAKYMAEHILTLPLYADLAPEDVRRICDLIIG